MIGDVKCQRDCEGGLIRSGSVLTVTGTALAEVVRVTFGGGATAKPRGVKAQRLRVRVPSRAASGSLVLTDALGQASAPSEPITIQQLASLQRSAAPIAAAITGKRVFVDGLRRPTLSYRLQRGRSARVTVTVVKQATGRVVKTFDEGRVRAGTDQLVVWNGSRQGRYAFVVSAQGPNGLSATTAQAPQTTAFRLLGHKFPIRGKHEYGDGLGAGRGHQGVDVFAACGAPIVAARGGTVKMAKYQSRAGNYIVIDGAQTGVDYMYAHLREPALFQRGDRVHTGDVIGYNGDTGSASGCHLHFEMWSAPVWYTGGSPLDPMADLRAWDAYS